MAATSPGGHDGGGGHSTISQGTGGCGFFASLVDWSISIPTIAAEPAISALRTVFDMFPSFVNPDEHTRGALP